MTDGTPRRPGAGAGDPAVMAAGFDQAGANLMVLEGPDLVVRAFNSTILATLGDRPWIGRPFVEVGGDLLGQQWFELLREVYDTGRTITGSRWRTHIARPDGEQVAIVIDHVLRPWRDESGAIKGVVALSVDVTAAAQEERDAEVSALAAEVREARQVVTTLQRALLPADVPALPGLEVAARYLLAAGDQAAGGDWYDVVAQPDGRAALVVGDVVGHGVAASAAMGQLRALAVDRLETGAAPDEVIAALDRFAARRPDARATTVCIAVLDPATGALSYCTAGHPPPLVIPTGEGEGRYLAPSGGGPLGTGAAFPTASDTLADGEVLLLYTDGIVERPNRAMPQSTLELRQVATAAARNEALPIGAPTVVADRVCEQVLELMTRATGHADDITLLAARRVPRPAPLRLRLAADAAAVWGARGPLAEWLTAVAPGPEDIPVAKAVVTELVQNAVDHAYSHTADALRGGSWRDEGGAPGAARPLAGDTPTDGGPAVAGKTAGDRPGVDGVEGDPASDGPVAAGDPWGDEAGDPGAARPFAGDRPTDEGHDADPAASDDAPAASGVEADPALDGPATIRDPWGNEAGAPGVARPLAGDTPTDGGPGADGTTTGDPAAPGDAPAAGGGMDGRAFGDGPWGAPSLNGVHELGDPWPPDRGTDDAAVGDRASGGRPALDGTLDVDGRVVGVGAAGPGVGGRRRAGRAPDGPVVEVDARVQDDGTLVLSVTDHGRWRPADPGRPGRGIGLTFVEQLVDDLDVERGDEGTRVTARFALRRPAGLLGADGTRTGAAPLAQRAHGDAYATTYRAGPPARLLVHGAVDAGSAPDLHYELARRAPTGTELVVDLGGVTLLASAGVHALARALDEARARHATLRVVAPSGTAAHHVLTLTHLPMAPEGSTAPP